jgi:hypothetical protein
MPGFLPCPRDNVVPAESSHLPRICTWSDDDSDRSSCIHWKREKSRCSMEYCRSLAADRQFWGDDDSGVADTEYSYCTKCCGRSDLYTNKHEVARCPTQKKRSLLMIRKRYYCSSEISCSISRASLCHVPGDPGCPFIRRTSVFPKLHPRSRSHIPHIESLLLFSNIIVLLHAQDKNATT